jgi:hypothetical protein
MESLMILARTKKQQVNLAEYVLLGLILISVLFCAVLLAFPLWFGITQITSLQPDSYRCVAINSDFDRLNCYDRLAGRPPTPPARGANPPELFPGR